VSLRQYVVYSSTSKASKPSSEATTCSAPSSELRLQLKKKKPAPRQQRVESDKGAFVELSVGA
jgi:hypothetical protein